MPIDAVSAVSAAVTSVQPTRGTQATSGPDFGAVLAGAIDEVQAQQAASNRLAVQAVTGDLTDIHDATIAATRSAVTLELVATVRNKGVEAFNEIMRMQA
ncbi:flagellar hook-basal body complex protein FliE [Diaminobutyricimonas aerilata]|uniref:Flagellar hook-basal body complex protein FliE n=1 Tax=Diaminobutyricimonas aerilata TaxID=1162967 RepID=A0A2M9CN22_9MICO|nr:flagellar hook-basal body complex protein FliE [Diaminobutyricimonas aerilata]PJJ73291.1 flagellar hook-basal body complex protein FliE [Diaminobutyricimonas aerilata]